MWKIIDDNGELYSGTLKEIQMIWDFLTRDIPDLANEYRYEFTQDQLVEMSKPYQDIEWSGDLHLIQIHETIPSHEQRNKIKVSTRHRD